MQSHTSTPDTQQFASWYHYVMSLPPHQSASRLNLKRTMSGASTANNSVKTESTTGRACTSKRLRTQTVRTGIILTNDDFCRQISVARRAAASQARGSDATAHHSVTFALPRIFPLVLGWFFLSTFRLCGLFFCETTRSRFCFSLFFNPLRLS